MFEQLRRRASEFIDKILTTRIKPEKIFKVLEEFRLYLLECDVAFPVVEKILEKLRDKLLNIQIRRFEDIKPLAENSLRETLIDILKFEGIDLMKLVESKKSRNLPTVLLFVGFNGTGKTLTLAKIAKLLKDHDYTVVLACSDTFRAGAIEQLREHAHRLKVPIIERPYGADPASVAYDAIAHAKARRINAVLIDTAGRAETDQNLMRQMRKIAKVSNPDLTIFVGDALTGNSIIEQAKRFSEFIEIDCLIVTKVDADTKGGAVLSLSCTTGKPIIYLGSGQRYEDLIPFNPEFIVNKILG